MRKIALTGAHGTGKSTLAHAAFSSVQHSCKAAWTPEVPRLFTDELGDATRFRRKNNSFGWQTLIVARQIEIESSAHRETEILICDRTVVDHWAYTQILFPEQCRTQEGAAWRSIVGRWVKTYDLIVRLPIEFQVKDGGTRESDIDFQNNVDQMIQDLYREFGISVTTIGGSLSLRIETLSSMIHRLRLPQQGC